LILLRTGMLDSVRENTPVAHVLPAFFLGSGRQNPWL
jgi:hypothetical protein